jgi:addiction module HigA family antidote
MMNQMRPVHPGEVLKEELEAINMNANTLAGRLDVPANRITSILKEQRGITADTALRLSRFFGTTAEFWLNLQMAYELKVAQEEKGKLIFEKIKPVAA